MKINSNTIKLEKESYEKLEEVVKKIASENKIENVSGVQIKLSKENGVVKFAIGDDLINEENAYKEWDDETEEYVNKKFDEREEYIEHDLDTGMTTIPKKIYDSVLPFFDQIAEKLDIAPDAMPIKEIIDTIYEKWTVR